MLIIRNLNFNCYNYNGLAESKPRRRRKKSKGGEAGGAGAKKRKLSAEQVNLLELHFGNEHKLESERKDRLASELGLDPRQVAVWFQNRRARWKNKKLEEEYSTLKKAHDAAILDKCRLESEVYINLSSLSLSVCVCLTVCAYVFVLSCIIHLWLFLGPVCFPRKLREKKKLLFFCFRSYKT